MAADFITINRTKQFGQDTVTAANLLLQLRATLARLTASANHMVNASDYSVLEQQFGLQTGSGANFNTLLNILCNTLNGTNGGGAGGVTQQGQLDEFCARIAGQ